MSLSLFLPFLLAIYLTISEITVAFKKLFLENIRLFHWRKKTCWDNRVFHNITKHSSLPQSTPQCHSFSIQTPTDGKREQAVFKFHGCWNKHSLFSRETEISVPLVQTHSGILGPIIYFLQREEKGDEIKRVRKKMMLICLQNGKNKNKHLHLTFL